jgi:hypothetical protein
MAGRRSTALWTPTVGLAGVVTACAVGAVTAGTAMTCSCAAAWIVAFMFRACELAETLFCCETGPALPGLSTDTGAFALPAPNCNASAPEFAACVFSFD